MLEVKAGMGKNDVAKTFQLSCFPNYLSKTFSLPRLPIVILVHNITKHYIWFFLLLTKKIYLLPLPVAIVYH